MIGISAIIATYKRETQLKQLFDSFVSNNCSGLEVIVVDQNKDNLIDALIAEYKSVLNITHLKIEVANQSYARNYGASYARHSLICFPDDDCWFDNDSINKILEHFQYNATTDLLIINWRQSPVASSQSMALSKKDIFSYKAPTNYATYVMFFKTEVFFRLGCFIETIGLGRYIGGGEDTELIFRTAKNGFKIYYEGSIYVNHKYTDSTERDLKSIRARQRGTGFVYSRFKLSRFVILRGFFAPFLKMIFSMNLRKSQVHYNIFMARMEGFMYGFKKK